MTATKKQDGQQVLTPQQIQIAAQAGARLISEGRVDVPSDMAMNGTLQALNGVLLALAQGSVVLADPKALAELQEKATPKKTPRKKAPAKKKASSKKR